MKKAVNEKLDATRASRFNDGKLDYTAYPVEFEEEIAKVATNGALKYALDNYKLSLNTEDHEKFQRDRMSSAIRHIVAYRKGERIDQESLDKQYQTQHLAHAAWNLLMIMYYDLNLNKT